MENQALIKTVVVDDEEGCMSSLIHLINKHCPELYICGIARNVTEALEVIEDKKPELVFLDIHLPDGDGFEILNKLNYRNFEVIFTTAYDRFALKAIEFSALYYILKPIGAKELIISVERFKNLQHRSFHKERFEVFKENYQKKPTKYIFQTADGFCVIEIDQIMKIESAKRFTIIHTADGSQYVITKYLSDLENELNDFGFFRIHLKYLINMKYIVKFQRERQVMIQMQNGEMLEVAQRKTSEFIEVFQQYVQKNNLNI